jgi:DNA-binding beta-propeller fold protein YncE
MFGAPRSMRLASDGSLIVSVEFGPATQVYPGKLPMIGLDSITNCASNVVPVGDEVRTGLIVVRCEDNVVHRTGTPAWRQTRLSQPFAALVRADCVLVTVRGRPGVVRLDRDTGKILGDFAPKTPLGPATDITAGPGGKVLVLDEKAKAVWIFTAGGEKLLTFGPGELEDPRGLCADKHGRVFVADFVGKAIVVFDIQTGVRLARIACKVSPVSVAVQENLMFVCAHNGKFGELMMTG